MSVRQYRLYGGVEHGWAGLSVKIGMPPECGLSTIEIGQLERALLSISLSAMGHQIGAAYALGAKAQGRTVGNYEASGSLEFNSTGFLLLEQAAKAFGGLAMLPPIDILVRWEHPGLKARALTVDGAPSPGDLPTAELLGAGKDPATLHLKGVGLGSNTMTMKQGDGSFATSVPFILAGDMDSTDQGTVVVTPAAE